MRSNESTPVRLIHSFCETDGTEFLKRILLPLHSAMSPMTPSVDERQAVQLTSQMLQSVYMSLENGSFPISLWRVLLSVFQIAVRIGLPRPIEGVSCVLFLRYLHVALVSPDSHHLSTHPLPPASQKIAVQVAKLSQAAVNAVVERTVSLFGNSLLSSSLLLSSLLFFSSLLFSSLLVSSLLFSPLLFSSLLSASFLFSSLLSSPLLMLVLFSSDRCTSTQSRRPSTTH
jgi:hypothetical protein